MKETRGILYRTQKDFPEEGVTFVDLTPTLLDNLSKNMTINEMLKLIINNYEDNDIDYIISPDARGFIWGTAISMKLDLPIIPVRKHGKLPETCTELSVKYDTEYSTTQLDLPKIDLFGKKCLFVDDVYATGGTYKACRDLVEKAGGKIIGAIVVLDIDLDKNSDKVYSVIHSGDVDYD